ncbi:MAG: hypothetical protein B2I17_03385 [Thermoplasmatales archaeon B_DKE]|nr:MAG: hypothetical protein B2I17_03385 [Thermoplasmatales archaeon B_DKE]
MKANDTTFKALIEGVKQFMIPVYQRTYAWDPDQRKTKGMTVDKMWDDIHELLDPEETGTHFFGSVVTMPVPSGASEVSKFVVIDGQQRLISLSLLLTAIRNAGGELKVDEGPHIHFVANLEESFLFNRLRDGDDRYKIIPTRSDRPNYFKILDQKDKKFDSSDRLVRAFDFFSRQVKQSLNEFKEVSEKMNFLQNLLKTLLNRLKIVDVRLDENDDPYEVFESLNYTGIQLFNWDLVRNYILMHYKKPEIQEEKYLSVIKEIENNIGDHADEFLKAYLGMNGIITTSRNIYNKFKVLISDNSTSAETDFEKEIVKLTQSSEIYRKLLNPNEIEDIFVRNLIEFTSSCLKISTHYPVLMKLFKVCDEGLISKSQLHVSLKMVASYLLRCTLKDSTRGLNNFFPPIATLIDKNPETLLRNDLTTGYGALDDNKFIEILENSDVGTNNGLVKCLLFNLEQSLNKEVTNLDRLQLEHIMPQTLDQDWKNDLGDNWERIHETYLNKIGNLTLTAYNQELQNFAFNRKKRGENGYENSSLKITKELASYEKWGEDEIKDRGHKLAEKIGRMWLI